jgi:ABC-type uncharacterized transport system substrate-binding protein
MRKALALVICAVVVACLSGCAAKTLLLVTEYPDGSPRVAEMEKAITRVFRFENMPFDLVVYNMDVSARDSDIWREQVGHNAMMRVLAFKPTLTFVAGDEAAKYFAQRMVDQPRKMIYLDIEAPPSTYKLTSSRFVTGVVEETPVREAFQLMRDLLPQARGVAVLSDKSLEGNAVVAKIRLMGELPIPVVDIRQVDTLGDWMAAIQDLQGKADALCVVSYHALLKNAEGPETVPAAEVMALTSKINRLPDFSFRKEAVGADGVMAAVAVPAGTQAVLAARMAVRALYYGDKIGDMRPAVCSQYETITSPERAAQLGVTLPAAQPAGPQGANP